MPWWAVIEDATGRLDSATADSKTVAALPPGFVVKELAGSLPDWSKRSWDPATRADVVKAADTQKDRIADFMADPDITSLTSTNRTKVQNAIGRLFAAEDLRAVRYYVR